MAPTKHKADTRAKGRVGGRGVMEGTKHDRRAGKVAEHPAMDQLSRTVTAGEVDRVRTLAYLDEASEP